MRSFLFLAALLATAPSVAFAQTGSEAPREEAKREAAERNELPAPTGRNDSLLQGVNFNLEVNDDQSAVSMQIGKASVREKQDAEGQRFDQINSNWLVKLTVPIEGLDDLKPGSQLDLLADGTKLTFSYSIFTFGSSVDAFTTGRFQDQIWGRALEACRNEKISGGKTRAQAVDECDMRDGEKRAVSVQFARQYLNDDVVDGALYRDTWRFGVEGAIGSDKFEYIDPVTLAAMSPNKTQASGAAFISLYPGGSTSVLTGRIEYQNGFEAQKEQAVCKPVIVDPAVDCVSGSLAPKHVERANLSVEYRRVFDLEGGIGNFAISPKVTYDTLSDVVEAEFPLYFIPKNAGPFSPGVELRYSSKTDEVTLGFFVRSTFKF